MRDRQADLATLATSVLRGLRVSVCAADTFIKADELDPAQVLCVIDYPDPFDEEAEEYKPEAYAYARSLLEGLQEFLSTATVKPPEPS